MRFLSCFHHWWNKQPQDLAHQQIFKPHQSTNQTNLYTHARAERSTNLLGPDPVQYVRGRASHRNDVSAEGVGAHPSDHFHCVDDLHKEAAQETSIIVHRAYPEMWLASVWHSFCAARISPQCPRHIHVKFIFLLITHSSSIITL